MTHETNPGGMAGLTLMRARDGDLLVVMDGAGLVEGDPVDVGVSGGSLVVAQGGHPPLAGGPVGEAVARDLGRARRVSVVEVYAGETPDEDRFVLHHDTRIAVPAG